MYRLKAKNDFEVAKKMLQKGMNDNTIEMITDLSKSEIENLKKDMWDTENTKAIMSKETLIMAFIINWAWIINSTTFCLC